MDNNDTTIRPKHGMAFIHATTGETCFITSVRNGRVHYRVGSMDGCWKILTVLDAAQNPKMPMSFFGSHFGSWVEA